MATRQDIDSGTAVNMAGTVPGGHALAPIRQRLLDEPRARRWVIGEVVNNSTKITHPAEAEDQRAPCIQFVEMVGITAQSDCDQLAAMAARARRELPGQLTIDDAMTGDGTTPGDEVPDGSDDQDDDPEDDEDAHQFSQDTADPDDSADLEPAAGSPPFLAAVPDGE